MGCSYEEEIYKRDEVLKECGCKKCPYKNLKQCKEVIIKNEKN